MTSINDLATAASAVSALAPAQAPSSTSTTVSVSSPVPATAVPSSAAREVTRGALVILEGLDRSGKTTQVKLLEQRFVELGRKVKVMRFPGGWMHDVGQ
jgi:dTMP kinase